MWCPHDISICHEMTSGDTFTYVIEALWMEGVWSWAYHIQAIHS